MVKAVKAVKAALVHSPAALQERSRRLAQAPSGIGQGLFFSGAGPSFTRFIETKWAKGLRWRSAVMKLECAI